MREVKSAVVLGICLVFAALPASAASPLADVSLGTMQVEWQPTGDFAGMRLRVSGPLGVVEQDFGAGENPLFDLRSMETVTDGLYTWEIVAAPRLDEGVRRAMAAARAEGDGAAEGRLRASGALPNAADMVQSGSFRVVGGVILVPTSEAEPSPAVRRVTSQATGGDLRRVTAEDQVIPDDLIVQGSLCVGFDCVNNENFSFDTVRLKENNTRLTFIDTSTASGFPAGDWQIRANDSSSGGANFLSIDWLGTNATTGNAPVTTPFRVEGAAPSNALRVDSTGRVGLRTASPVLDLHIATSNTPGIRLEQTNAGGFSARTWDIAGNEANFFVRDVTGGSRLPFRIRPGAPTSSIDIAASGNVGIGTASPQQKLHVVGDSGSTQFLLQETSGTELERTVFKLENNGVAVFAVQDTSADGSTWAFKAEGPSFRVNKFGTGGEELVVRDRFDGTGQATLVVNGSVQATNVTFSSSRELKTGFAEVDTREMLSRLVALPMTGWEFKEEKNGRRHIGPIAEDFNEAFALGGDAAHISVVDANGVTMAAVQGLHQEVVARDAQIADLQRQVDELTQIVQRLAAAPANHQE